MPNTKSPTLYRLAADRRYADIPAAVRNRPADLHWTDRYGSTALHILCQARHVDKALLAAVDAILILSPELVAWANVATWTPLHFAVEKRLVWGGDAMGTALILRLIRACPSAVSLRTSTGFKTKTPFHIACEADADYVVLKAMLSIMPQLAVEPYVKKDVYSVTENPLQLLWKNYQYEQNSSSATHRGSSNRRGGYGDSSANCWSARNQTLQKMALLLAAAHHGRVDGLSFSDACDGTSTTASTNSRDPSHVSSNFRLLNAACSVRCPRDYFVLVLQQCHDQVYQPDSDGLFALHYAVQNAAQDSQSYTQFVVQSLVELHPAAAAICDATGRLPLHVAVTDTLMTWHKGGVRELVFANPNALRAGDPACSGLVPFLASACHADVSRLHLSTTYELLLAAPEMVVAVSNRRSKNSKKNATTRENSFGFVFMEG